MEKFEKLREYYWKIRSSGKLENIEKFWAKYGRQFERKHLRERFANEISDYESILKKSNKEPEVELSVQNELPSSTTSKSLTPKILKVENHTDSAYAGMGKSFPVESGFKFGNWWPNPGEPAHIMVLGKTGSGKSDLIQRLFKEGDFGETSYHYVTDKNSTEPPISKMKTYARNKLKRLQVEDPSLCEKYATRSTNPNFMYNFTNTEGFNSYFSLEKLQKECPKSGAKQHTVVVFDDDSYPDKLYLARIGRSRGLSCIIVQQDWVSEHTKSGVRPQLSGVWFVGPMGRNNDDKEKYASALNLNRADVQRLQDMLKNPQTHAVFVNPNSETFHVIDKKTY